MSDGGKNESVSHLLRVARQKINTGHPGEALEIVMEVIRASYGESAVMRTLDDMKCLMENSKNISNLCEQMEESLIIDNNSLGTAEIFTSRLMNEATILQERGDEDILRDAFEDGSSLICTNCGDLISRARWRQHSELWCPAACDGMEDSD